MQNSSMDLHGKTCLITGANSGLGKAIAVQMARKGASIIMACRKKYTAAQSEIQEKTGNKDVSLRLLDLSSLPSVSRFCDQLLEDKVSIDLAFFNAGMVSATNTISQDGFSLLWQVNYLSNVLLVKRMLVDGVIPNAVFCDRNNKSDSIPRIIFTSSSRHRGELSIDFDHFGKFEGFQLRDIFKWYGLSKLYLMTYAWELGRQLIKEGKPEVSVHAFCPGPFRSLIGKGAGGLAQLVMSCLPTNPEKAAWPAVHLACATELEGTTLQYFHKRKSKEPDPRVADPNISAKLWVESEKLISAHLR
jgi:NAD(P)-dependent dehydrogenase (short-subunit alcohol dehydrogenase family)